MNYLIPHHVSENNSAVIDRKLREEGGEGRSQTSAHLEGIRSPVEAPGEMQWRDNVAGTVREWNEGFFGPRGVSVELRGGYDQVHRQQQGDGTARDAGPGRGSGRGLFGRFGSWPAPEDRDNNGNNNNNNSRGFRLGGIAIGDGRISIGDGIVVDRNDGIRIGDIVAERHGGVSRRGNPLFGGAPPSCGRGGPPGVGIWSPFGGRGGGGPFGRGGGPFGGPGQHPLRGPGPFSLPGRDGGPGRHGHGGRGRGRGRHGDGEKGRRSRSKSTSSTSSSSSSASTASVESVGSLPDYDQLRDSQLPLTKDFLQKWLDHPDQPITKESVRQVRASIKAAAKSDAQSRACSSNPNNSIHPSQSPPFDHAALRKEVKALMGEWRALKRQQTKEARQLKRQRREAKRAAKRERREAKRALRQERREQRRQGRRGPPGQGLFGGLWGAGVVPPVAGIPAPPPAPAGLFGRGGFFDGFGGSPVGRAVPEGSRHAPGAWPEEGIEGSKGKYAIAEGLEREIVEKEEELLEVHQQIVQEDEENTGGGRAEGDGKTMSAAVRKALELEKVIDGLAGELQRVRTAADAAFARELADLELG